MLQSWKLSSILKGVLTWVPLLNAWRVRHASTGGTNRSRYCYSVWLRHLVTLASCGFKIDGARVGELGPGDSIGVGIAALMAGARHYSGLDVFPFAEKTNLEPIVDEIYDLYCRREPIPDQIEYPGIRPQLDSYAFPSNLVDCRHFEATVTSVRNQLKSRLGLNEADPISYRAPVDSSDPSAAASLDLLFSQAVLQCVDLVQDTYDAMFAWLKPGGYSSHAIGLDANYVSPFWNGHWAYSDWEWRLVRGRREFFINREPLSAHVTAATKAGFEVLLVKQEYKDEGLERKALSPRFRSLDIEDRRTRGVFLILRKPR